jgi:hypothetical protein
MARLYSIEYKKVLMQTQASLIKSIKDRLQPRVHAAQTGDHVGSPVKVGLSDPKVTYKISEPAGGWICFSGEC